MVRMSPTRWRRPKPLLQRVKLFGPFLLVAVVVLSGHYWGALDLKPAVERAFGLAARTDR